MKAQCNEGFPVHDGAFIRELDTRLGEMHIHREAYYGGTFTGNNAHRCLKVHVAHAHIHCNLLCIYMYYYMYIHVLLHVHVYNKL